MKKVLKKLVIFSLFILIPCMLFSNFVGMNWGARPMALGEAYIALANDPSAVFWNPAGLANFECNLSNTLKKKYYNLPLWMLSNYNYYDLVVSHQNLFNINNLYNQMAALSFPLYRSRIGIGWSQINLLDEYAEQVIAVSAASIIWYKHVPIRFGISLNNYSVRAPGYDGAKNSSKFDATAGLITTPLKDFSVGFVARNLFERSFKMVSEYEKLERNYTLGTHYRWRDVVNFLLDYQWDKDESSMHFGWEIWFFDVFAPRIGLNREYLTVGFGLKAKHWNLDGAVYSHEELGSTYRLSFGIHF